MKRSYSKTTGSVNIATLKAQLAKYLRLVKAGEEIVVTEHQTPVARIVPFDANEPLESIKPKGNFGESIAKMKVPRIEKKPGINSLTLLLEERGSR
jgi:prevent-host-death family protein